MLRIAIIAKNFYSFETSRIAIGGVESYIQELYTALHEQYLVEVFQPGTRDASASHNGIPIKQLTSTNAKQLTKKVEAILANENDILIFSTDQWAAPTKHKKTIVIQHGIYWDLPAEYYANWNIAKRLQFPYKLLDAVRNYLKIRHFKKIVCVDYIYPTWYKTLFSPAGKEFHIIPNFTSFCRDQKTRPTNDKSDDQFVNVLFARRFVEIRGVKVAIAVAKNILQKYPNARFSFIGEGPLEKVIHKELGKHDRVTISAATHSEMRSIISSHHIVIIPSMGSEGTSLIAIESMALGKAIIASNIGGLTNIIIDGYNGYLCKPEELEFTKRVSQLIETPHIRHELENNAECVARQALTKSNWSAKWEEVLREL